MKQERSHPIEKLLSDLKNGSEWGGVVETKPKPGEATIQVPLITSSAATLYERMRSLLDNKEQHVVRWHTIYRTLGRLMRMHSSDAVIAKKLLQELVADGFLPNDTIPVSASNRMQYVLLKYRVLNERFHLPDLFRVAVSEIESTLYGNRKELFVRALYETACNTVTHNTTSKRKEDADLCLYLGCRKAFLEDDEAGLLYGVWLKYFPEWETTVDIEGACMENVPMVLHLAADGIADPAYRKLARKLHDLAVYFSVLKGMADTQEKTLFEGEMLEKEKNIRETLDRLSEMQYRSARGMGMRAFWYVLITKTAIILPIEYAVSSWLFPPVEMIPLFINLAFHPLTLLAMTQTIREPRRVNADMIVFGVARLLSMQPLEPIRIQTNKRARTSYLGAYVVVVVGVFSLLVWALGLIGFTPINILFFAVLLGIVSFFAFRVRTKARKFTLRRYVGMYPPNFWFSVFTIPFIDAGRRLSEGFRAINIFTEVMDFFIEVPFKTFMRVVGVIVPFLEKTVFRFIQVFFISPILFFRRMKRAFSFFIREKKEEID